MAVINRAFISTSINCARITNIPVTIKTSWIKATIADVPNLHELNSLGIFLNAIDTYRIITTKEKIIAIIALCNKVLPIVGLNLLVFPHLLLQYHVEDIQDSILKH